MTSLYQSGYRPPYLPKKYEATSISVSGEGQAADVMRAKGVPVSFGEPVDAVAFWDDKSDQLRSLVCDYANGHRVEYRCTGRKMSLLYGMVPA
jgi:hypothetical protein